MAVSNNFRTLSDEDLRHVLRICEQLHLADPAASFIHHCRDTLNQAFSKVHFSAELYQLRGNEIHPPDNNDWIPVFKGHVLDHPFAERMFTLSAPERRMTHLDSSLKKPRQSTLRNDSCDQAGAQNQVWIGLSDRSQLLCCIYSRETEYTEDELAMMCIIQPHLEAAWKNWRRTLSLKQELDLLKDSTFQTEAEEAAAAQLRRMIDALTGRQRDVVELVAQGRDNQQIADALKISILTVKKHLQMIFHAMDIQHRTALAAQWHRAYSIQVY